MRRILSLDPMACFVEPPYLVECPRCFKRAAVDLPHAGLARLVCGRCGLAGFGDLRPGSGRAVDPCLGLRLWLRGHFRGQELYALNFWHLGLIEDYVRASAHRQPHMGSKTLLNSLQALAKSARNREGLLRTLNRMRYRA